MSFMMPSNRLRRNFKPTPSTSNLAAAYHSFVGEDEAYIDPLVDQYGSADAAVDYNNGAQLVEDGLNGFNTIENTNGRYDGPTALNATTSMSQYYVFNRTTDGFYACLWAHRGTGLGQEETSLALYTDYGDSVNQLTFRCAFNDATDITLTHTISNGVWYHASIHYASGRQELWVDGLLVDSDTVAGKTLDHSGGNHHLLGRFQSTGQFEGELAEWLAYSSINTSGEIARNHNYLAWKYDL